MTFKIIGISFGLELVYHSGYGWWFESFGKESQLFYSEYFAREALSNGEVVYCKK